MGVLLSFQTAFADSSTPNGTDIAQVKQELQKAYETDIAQMSAPPSGGNAPVGKDPVDLAAEHHLLSSKLHKHLGNIGGLDFDIFLNAQDWDKKWAAQIGDPVRKGKNHYEIPVSLNRDGKICIATWQFVREQGAWVADDIRYEEPGEKTFTLNSLQEGD